MDRALLGAGFDGFRKKYMDYQAEYFRQKVTADESFVAGDVNYAFNEPLELATEYGLVGIGIIFFIFYFLFRRIPVHKHCRANNNGLMDRSFMNLNDANKLPFFVRHISIAMMLSFVVFGLFSYPSEILPVKICFVIAFTAYVASTKEFVGNLSFRFHIPGKLAKYVSLVTVLFLLPAGSIHISKTQTAYIYWKSAVDFYNYGLLSKSLQAYEEAYPYLKNNGIFLSNYGKALARSEKFEKAIFILERGVNFYSNTVSYTALGDSFKGIGEIALAEKAYLQAWYMNPGRFYPKYLLAILYEESGQIEKALDVAHELIQKKAKIESDASRKIVEKMNEIIARAKTQTNTKSTCE